MNSVDDASDDVEADEIQMMLREMELAEENGTCIPCAQGKHDHNEYCDLPAGYYDCGCCERSCNCAVGEVVPAELH